MEDRKQIVILSVLSQGGIFPAKTLVDLVGGLLRSRNYETLSAMEADGLLYSCKIDDKGKVTGYWISDQGTDKLAEIMSSVMGHAYPDSLATA